MGAAVEGGTWLCLTTDDDPPHPFAWKEVVCDVGSLRIVRGPVATRTPPTVPPVNLASCNFICSSGVRLWSPTAAKIAGVVGEAGGLAVAVTVQRQGAAAQGLPVPRPFPVLGAVAAAVPIAVGAGVGGAMGMPAWPAGLIAAAGAIAPPAAQSPSSPGLVGGIAGPPNLDAIEALRLAVSELQAK